MGYVEQNLIPGENVIYRARLHWIVLFWPGVIAILFGLPGLALLMGSLGSTSSRDGSAGGMAGMGIILLLVAAITLAGGVLARSAAQFAVTNKRVILKMGVVRRRTLEMFLNKIESVGVDQGIIGRMLGYGSIVVRGTGGSAEPFDKIYHPLEFRHQVQQQIGGMS